MTDTSTFPFIVKPVSEGSSIGITLIKNRSDWDQFSAQHPNEDTQQYFYEEYLTGQEITSGVIEIDEKATVLPILEIKTSNEFLDFDAKYTPGKETFILPANISLEIQHKVESISKTIYQFFNCKGCIRIDFIIHNGEPKVLEMNTNPGLTKLSYIPFQAKAMGIEFDDLMIHYLNSAK